MQQKQDAKQRSGKATKICYDRAVAAKRPFAKLTDHYVKTLEAYHFGGHLMIINTIAANKRIDKYFKSI